MPTSLLSDKTKPLSLLDKSAVRSAIGLTAGGEKYGAGDADLLRDDECDEASQSESERKARKRNSAYIGTLMVDKVMYLLRFKL